MTYTHDDTDRPFYEAVYDFLVEYGKAVNNSTDKEIFVRYFTQREHKGMEFRCVGALPGGKFWRNDNRFYVNYYLEHRTKQYDCIEAKLNELLAELTLKMKPNPDGPERTPQEVKP